MEIYSLLSEETVKAGLRVTDKDDLLNKLIDLLHSQLSSEQLESVREAVFEREGIMSTGVGKGLAIPHGKVGDIDESYASFALLDEPIDFDSIDGKPVRIAFLLVGPAQKNSMHIKLLSRISRLLNNADFRERLLKSGSPEEILNCFQKEEEQYFKA